MVLDGRGGRLGRRARDIDSLTLVWPTQPIVGLRGNPADVIYPPQSSWLAVGEVGPLVGVRRSIPLTLDQLMVTGAVGGNVTGQSRGAAASSFRIPCHVRFCRSSSF